MSVELSGIASRKLAGNATRRVVLRTLTDQANNNGSGIYASVATLARDSEVSERTVQTHLKAFVAEGLLVIVGRRECRYGYTNEYAIDVIALKALPDIERAEDAPVKSSRPRKQNTGETAAPVKEVPKVQEMVVGSETITKPSGSEFFTGETAAPVKAEPAKENSPDPYKKTTSTSLRSVEVGALPLSALAKSKAIEPRYAGFTALWAAWRERDLIRRSRRAPCFEAYKRAVKAGADPERIDAGARAYLANPDKNKDRGQFMVGLVTFIDDQEWEEWADEWEKEARRRAALFEHDGFWDSKWGPKPNTNGHGAHL